MSCSEYRDKKWPASSVDDLLRKIDSTRSVERKAGVDAHGLSECNRIFRGF